MFGLINKDNCEQITIECRIACAVCQRRVVRNCSIEFDRTHNLPRFIVDLPNGWAEGFSNAIYCDNASCTERRDQVY